MTTMIKSIPNRQLTANYSLYDFIEARMPAEAVRLNWANIDEFDEAGYVRIAAFFQALRNEVNRNFGAENQGSDIDIIITSAFRCFAWERLRNRNGTSQHCIGIACDIQPAGCSNELAVKILQWLHRRHNPTTTGHRGGFALKHPTYGTHGQILMVGFAHYDFRGKVARWNY